jgi:hypothetical protein
MTATFPTAHPFPVASGGLERANATRPLRGPQSQYTRQPYLGSPPAISAATGFGGGAGAFILNNGSDADQSQGLVAVRVGVGASPSGEIVLAFPVAPTDGQYWFAADWATLAPQPVAGNDLALAWVATRTLVAGELVTLAYQWTVSQ